MHEIELYTVTERLTYVIKNLGRIVTGKHRSSKNGQIGNIVPVAGRDPWSADPNLPPDQRFKQARTNALELDILRDQLSH